MTDWLYDGENIDIIMVSIQCILAKELKDIGNEKFDGSQAERQIRQYSPCQYYAIWYLEKNWVLKLKA